MKRFKISLAKVLLCAVFLVIAAGCGKGGDKRSKETVVPVRVKEIKPQSVRGILDYVGDIKAEDEAVLYSRVGGKIIEKVKEEGDPVSKGEAVVYVDRDEVGFEFEKAPVESPLTGIVGRVYVDKGTQVTIQTPVALVVVTDNVKIQLDVPEKYITEVSDGQIAEVTVDAYPEEVFSGKVVSVSPVIDLDTRTAPVEILIPNPGSRLKSGMYARIKLIVREHKNVATVLKESVMGKDSNLHVYVADNGIARKRNIKTGMREGAMLEVVEGLNIGEQVVVMGQQKLHDGVKVSVEQSIGNGEKR